MDKEQKKEITLCPICKNKMISLQTCHLRCNNCGAELTCSDKGYFWWHKLPVIIEIKLF